MACGRCSRARKLALKKMPPPRRSPQLQQDGGILLPESMEGTKIEGYTQDPENPLKLLSDTDSYCQNRMTGILLQKDGSYSPSHICMEDKSPHKSQQVTPDICKACPFRSA